jgi:hypothetical protein
MNYKTKLFTLLLALTFLGGCVGMKSAQNAYTKDFGGYLVAKTECKANNFHEVNFKDSGGADASVKIAAECGDIQKPTHNGGAVAQQNSALITAGGGLIAAGLQTAANYDISKDNNATRVTIAELANEREASENAVLLQALEGSQSQTDALVEQNGLLGDLITELSADEDEELEDEFGDDLLGDTGDDLLNIDEEL